MGNKQRELEAIVGQESHNIATIMEMRMTHMTGVPQWTATSSEVTGKEKEVGWFCILGRVLTV